MLLTCQHCSRRFDVANEKIDGLAAVRCECGEKIALSGRGIARLGNYLLLHKIATGGMGEIFYGVVSGIEGFEREVAIKKMLPHLSQDRSFIDMMVKEAKLTVLLNHPNIVQVYDLSRDGDQYYIAMEYVPGVTIAHILQHTIKQELLLPVPVVVHVVSQLLRGLMYAHNLQTPVGPTSIIHRDITPQNVLITQRAAIKITDFGIARAVNEISTTSPGLIKGKMGYIAPEQLAGHAPSPQVDLFCAAIVLWEMLAGRRLFKGTTEVDTFRLIAEAEVPDLRTLRGDVPASLCEVVAQGLAKSPDKRFAHGDDFAAALIRSLAPLSADDIRLASEQFFRSHKALFADVYVPDSGETPVAAAPGELTAITRIALPAAPLPKPPEPPPLPVAKAMSGGRGLLLGGGAMAAAVALVAGGLWLRAGSAPTADSVQSHVPTTAPLAQPATPGAGPEAAPIDPAGATHQTGAAAGKTMGTAEGAPRQAGAADAGGQGAAAAPTAGPASPGGTAGKASGPAAGGAAPSAPAPAVPHAKAKAHRKAEAPADERPLTGQEIQKVVAGRQGAIARCLRGLDAKTAPKEVAAKVTIARDGSVAQVHFEPDFAGEQGTCVHEVLAKLTFRPHPYEGLQVTIPLRLQVF